MYKVLLGVLVLVFITMSAMLAIYMVDRPESKTEKDKPFPEFNLPLLFIGEDVTQETLKGKKRLVNIFASWCQSCLIEHPLLIKLKSDIEIVGISWRDKKEKTKEWLHRYGNPYKKVIVDEKSELVIKLGVTGAPESFLVNEQGVIIKHWPGPLTVDIVEEIHESK